MPHDAASTQHPRSDAASGEEWLNYDDFAAGIGTFRLPSSSLAGTTAAFTLDDGEPLRLDFREDDVDWQLGAHSGSDPYDAVRVRDDTLFIHLPLHSREREAITVLWQTSTARAIVVRSTIAESATPDAPQVSQVFWAASEDSKTPSGPVPGPSRDLIGLRNLYRYSDEHLYEHVYLSSERYSWQCLQGAQRGHGDTDLATVWQLGDGLYLFAFREFRIPVASIWLHDLGEQQVTTGAFLGLTSDGEYEHTLAGGRIIRLGRVEYPDVQPV